ncbi:hypothetical protein DFH11DRAFT_1878702 [Phellopilus nigrolimitatus]|nr:hypothetical protein DFH11DRAFT_1878702 [Phellopilus nigrolimitatus]
MLEESDSIADGSNSIKTDIGGKTVGNLSAKARKARELERRRARGEASCAECRRLKLKCNRKVPCATCVRRGCHSICPNGSLAPGQGTRFVLANTDKLHIKLLEMSKRIRQLEDALQIAQTSISPAPHPLLSEHLLSIKAGVDMVETEETIEHEEGDEEAEMSAAFGTLTISERGEARFVGRVGTEALLVGATDEEVPSTHKDSNPRCVLPDEINYASKAFPFTTNFLPKSQIIALIEARLPSYERATALAEAFLENLAWFFRPIQREQIMEDLIPLIYKKRRRSEHAGAESNIITGSECTAVRMHELALALMVFSCGAAGDLTLAPRNAEAELYNQLARAALSAQPVFSCGVSLETVQTVLLLASYDFYTCTKITLESAWKMMSFGSVLASSIGLHRDPAGWNLEPKFVQRRRSLFWEVFAIDKWKSLGSGRPAVFHLREIDYEFPEDNDATVGDDGTKIPGFYRWKYSFAKEIIAPISEQLCLVRPVKYSEIMELDRKLRDFKNHPLVMDLSKGDRKTANMQEYMWGISKEIALLFIHRNFFACAMLEHPANPLSSPFALSFLSAYSNAIKLLRVMRATFEQNSQVMLRQWPIWAHTLTAAVIVGSIASRSNKSTLATAALKELNLAIVMFEAAKVHPVAKRGLPILYRLREKAHIALQNACIREREISGLPLMPERTDEKDPEGDAELSILRGTARFVRTTSRNLDRHDNTGSTIESNASESEKSNKEALPHQGGFLDFAKQRTSQPTSVPNFAGQGTTDTRSTLASTFSPASQLGMASNMVGGSGAGTITGTGTNTASQELQAASGADGIPPWLFFDQRHDSTQLPSDFNPTSLFGTGNSPDMSAAQTSTYSTGTSHTTSVYTSASPLPYAPADHFNTPGSSGSSSSGADTWKGLGFGPVLDDLISESMRLSNSDPNISGSGHVNAGRNNAASMSLLEPSQDQAMPTNASTQATAQWSDSHNNTADYDSSNMSVDGQYLFGGFGMSGYGGHEGQIGMEVGDGGLDNSEVAAAWRSIIADHEVQFDGSASGFDMFP